MMRSLLKTLTTLALMATTVVAARAQTATDFPLLKGNPAGNGRNGSPGTSGPGQALLTFFRPTPVASNYEIQPIDVDNTDVGTRPIANLYPFGNLWFPIPYLLGAATATPALTGPGASYLTGYASPLLDDAASGPYVVRYNRAINQNPAQVARFREPGYFYTKTTPSDAGTSDPTVPAIPGERRYFEWSVGLPNIRPLNYALYTYIPVGSTNVPGVGRRFQQRYVAYEILFGDGGNQRFVEVVDTSQAGFGWVRLGNGGRQTDAVFPFDGTTRIRIRQYNTIPRDAGGQLTTGLNSQADLVYADAVKAVPVYGPILASPTAATLGGAISRVVTATNDLSVIRRGNSFEYVLDATVRAYNAGVTGGQDLWTFRPSDDIEADQAFRVDDSAGIGVTNAGFTTTPDPRFVNGAYLGALRTNDLPTASSVTYAPDLPEGDYEIRALVPGDPAFASRAVVQITNGEGTFEALLDGTRGRSYQTLGTRRYRHIPGTAPLSVRITNYSTATIDTGKRIAADEVRFVSTRLAVTSTPVHAQALVRKTGGLVQETQVVIVPDESGRIHCLDAIGNADGSTNEYWVYPSRRRTGFVDPNLSEGIDGPTTATVPTEPMPTGFDLSSGVVQRIDGKDYFFIASLNGRVYCIDMEGRGDYDFTTRTPGTARRAWTYPPTGVTSNLGVIRGSVVYSPAADGVGTIFVPGRTGRMVALRALPTNPATRTPEVRWQYPPATEAALGPIVMTPSVEFGRVYFGTGDLDDTGGRFYALAEDTGLPVWQFPTVADLAAGVVPPGAFICGPATVPAAVVGGQMPDTVYILNENGFLYALNAATGLLATDNATTFAPTDELGTGSDGNLTFTEIDTFDNFGVGGRLSAPVIVIPCRDGRYTAMFARASTLNRNGGRRAWEYRTQDDRVTATPTVANGNMFGADGAGFLYAWSNTGGVFGPGIVAPGNGTIVENDPAGDRFRDAQVKLLTQAAYQRLRQPNDNNLSYAEALLPANSFDRTPLAFEWGETAYILVYDYEYVTTNTVGNAVNPPIVNVALNVGGNTVRSLPVESRLFRGATVGDPRGAYSVLAFTFQGGGQNALPPGEAEIQISITTAALNSGNQLQNVALNPVFTRRTFQLANPLAIGTLDVSGSVISAPNSIGVNVFPNDPQNLVNGSPNVVGTLNDESRLLTSVGAVAHGGSGKRDLVIYDRSMMGLIRPDGLGLDNVRIGRRELQWQGLGSTVFKPLGAANYPGFEDLPLGIQPNLSLDYPDIPRDAVRFTKDPDGQAENPVGFGVTLLAPRVPNGSGGLRALLEGDRPEDRVLRPTPLRAQVDVPRFQPPNRARTGYFGTRIAGGSVLPADPRFFQLDAANGERAQGYLGRMTVFVDSSGNGALDLATREANRTFNLSAAVNVDQRVTIGTPSADPSDQAATLSLESLAGGAGISTDPAIPFEPWTNAYWKPMFKPFVVRNEGNVNLLDLRVMKGTFLPEVGATGNVLRPVPLIAGLNDIQAWLNGLVALASDMDADFAPNNLSGGTNRVTLQKARPGDDAPTELSPNPSRRENANLNVTDGPLYNIVNFPQGPPRIAVRVPVGFPAGRYSQEIRVIENDIPDELLELVNYVNPPQYESYTEPGLRLNFTVRESRLTGGPSTRTSPMVDDLLLRASGDPNTYTEQFRTRFAYRNRQPAALRDGFGGLVAAWSSDRPEAQPVGMPVQTNPGEGSRIYLAALDSGLDFTGNGISKPNAASSDPLRDLFNWRAASTGRWWSTVGPVPAVATPLTDLFGLGTFTGAPRFGNPAFPTAGVRDPYTDAIRSDVYMAYTGEIEASGGGRTTRSVLFLNSLAPGADGLNALPGTPVALADDTIKGKPALLQVGAGASVAYPATAGGTTTIMTSRFDGAAFGPTTALGFGPSFDAVSSVSLTGRNYFGALPGKFPTGRRIDVTFTGRLRNSAADEVFVGAIAADQAGLIPLDPATGRAIAQPFADMGERPAEVLVSGDGGTFRSRGIDWLLGQRVVLTLEDGLTSVFTAAPPVRNVTTGVVRYGTIFGGSAVVDPNLGTIRFDGGAPARNTVLKLTYTPRFIRISATGGSAYTSVSGLWDARNIADAGGWAPTNFPFVGTRNDRLIATYVRGAAGAGTTTRPFMTTWRIGLRLPFRIATNPNGTSVSVAVSGNTGPYQIDAAGGKIYFTSADEDRNIRVVYTAIDDAGTQTAAGVTAEGVTGLIQETPEAAILVEQAANETGLWSFLDPYQFTENSAGMVRPGLMWMFWTSGRNGGSEIFFQSVAPRLAPVGVGR